MCHLFRMVMGTITNHHPSWEVGKTQLGWGKKKRTRKRQRSVTGKKQPLQFNSNSGVDFLNKPLSNFDLFDWVKNLELNIFVIFSVEMLWQKRLEKSVQSLISMKFKDLEHIGFAIKIWIRLLNILIRLD